MEPAAHDSLADHPLARLPREDLDLIVGFVLESGSLKGLAKRHGVSYPTIRHRLNSLIARLEAAVDGKTPDPLTDLLARLVERGELAGGSARRILDAARQTRTNHQNGARP